MSATNTTNSTRTPRAMPLLLAALCQGRRGVMAAGALLASAATLAGALLLGISGWFITATAAAGFVAAGAGAAAIAFDVFTPAASIRLLALLRTFGRYGERLLTHSVALHALVGVRERLLRGFAARADDERAAREWRLQPARLLLRLTRDLDAAEALYLRLLVPAMAALFSALVISGWLLWQGHALLALAALAWLVSGGFGVAIWLLRATAPAGLSLSRHAEHMRQQALDIAGAQAELAMAGRLDATLAAVQTREVHLARLEEGIQARDALAGALWQALHSLTLAAATLCAAYLVLRCSMSAATAALFVLIAMAGMEPFTALRRGASQWAATELAARRLRLPLLAQAHEAPLPLPDAGLAVQLQGVRTRRTDRLDAAAAEGISLEVPRGDCVALVGASGSGKSTLLALAAGLLAPTHGSVRALPSFALTQQAVLFADSVRANLNLQQRNVPDEQLWAALRTAGLDDLMRERGGLDALLGEGGTGLSRGQQRRLALARLLLAGGELWLLDEPSDGLDAVTAADVLGGLSDALHGRSALIATHLRREAVLANQLVLLERGRITAHAARGSTDYERILAQLRDD